MSVEFFQTMMGRQFYEGTLPRLSDRIERLAKAVERSNVIAEKAEKKEVRPLSSLAQQEINDGLAATDEVVDGMILDWIQNHTKLETDGKAYRALKDAVYALMREVSEGELIVA